MEYRERVKEIISRENDNINIIVDEYVKGNEDYANKLMYKLFVSNGFYSDCEETMQIADHIGDLVGYAFKVIKESIWVVCENYPNFEVNVEGEIRRIKDKKMMKVENKRVKLSKDGKVSTVKVGDIVYDAFFNDGENKVVNMEYVDMNSDLNDIENDMNFTGNLIMSSTTENIR